MTKKLLFFAAPVGCLVLTSAAGARSAYDGSWDLIFVTQRGACDPTYNFSVNITNGIVTHPNLVKLGLCGAFRCRSSVRDRSGQICLRLGQAHREFRSRHLERPFRARTLLGYWTAQRN
jgi:hypothetical protein